MDRSRRKRRPTRYDVAMARTHRAGPRCSPVLWSPWYWLRDGGALRRERGPRATGDRWPWRAGGSEGPGGSRWRKIDLALKNIWTDANPWVSNRCVSGGAQEEGERVETRSWRLVIEYGPEREELGAVQLTGTEKEADAASLVLLKGFGRIARENGWEFGVSVRMSSPQMGG